MRSLLAAMTLVGLSGCLGGDAGAPATPNEAAPAVAAPVPARAASAPTTSQPLSRLRPGVLRCAADAQCRSALAPYCDPDVHVCVTSAYQYRPVAAQRRAALAAAGAPDRLDESMRPPTVGDTERLEKRRDPDPFRYKAWENLPVPPDHPPPPFEAP